MFSTSLEKKKSPAAPCAHPPDLSVRPRRGLCVAGVLVLHIFLTAASFVPTPREGMRRLFFSHVATAALCCHALPKVMRSRLAALARTLAPTLSQVACLVNNTGKQMQHPRGLPGGVPPSRASFSSPHPTPASPHATPRLWDSGPARSLHFLLCKCVPVPRQLK